MNYRIGLGKDSHRFVYDEELEANKGKPFVIGGVHIPQQKPFKAHSDGDVLYHAVFNAIASALGLKSIGHYFPDTSDSELGRDSAEYLQFIVEKLAESNAQVENLSIVVECKRPKVDPISDRIKSNLSELLGVSINAVSITATSGEEVSPWGKGLGVEVTCSTLISST